MCANCLCEIMCMYIDHVSFFMLRFACHVHEIHKNNVDMHWMKAKNVLNWEFFFQESFIM